MTFRATQFFFCALPFLFALSSLLPLPGGIDISTIRLFPLILFLILLSESALYKKRIHISVTWVVIATTLFFTWSILSLFYSAVPSWTARKLFFLATFAPLFIVIPTLWQWYGKAGISGIIRSLVLGSFLISLVGIIQFLMQFVFSLDAVARVWQMLTPFFLGATFSESVATFNSWYVHIGGHDLFRAIAFFPDPHIFAYFTGMTLPLAFGLFRSEKKFTFLLAFFVILLANIFTFSRGGEVALIVGAFFAVIFEWQKIPLHYKHGLFAALLFLILLLLLPSNPLTHRFISSFDSSDSSNSIRLTLWKEAVETISQKPVLGVGLGAYALHVDPRATYRTPIYAHNTYLDIAVETGLVGLFFFLAVLLASLKTFFKERSDALARYVMISILIFMTHGLFDTPLFSVHIMPLLILLVILSVTYGRIPQK